MFGLTALAAKADGTGLIGAECSCIHNSFRTRQIESSEDRGASVGSVKSAFIYGFPLYLLTSPMHNLPSAPVIIDAVNKATVITKGYSEFKDKYQSGGQWINQERSIRIAGSLIISG
ncbi:hypothetical protein FQA39_LY04993 [Lamprigera yunnana]|nr:hypothetical protein FQA39_LY04993 [Lamprigera yunnana]